MNEKKTDVVALGELLIVDTEVNTTLAFVHTYENGDRDF